MSKARPFLTHVLTSAALFAVSAALCTAQSIAPAHSGTVHYFEGDVTVDGVKLVSQVARFTNLKEQSVLQTGLGRAEILLTPGVLLRIGENTSVKMLDNRLVSTRVEFVSGIAMVEAVDSGTSVKDPAVTIVYKDFEAQPLRNGVFELTSAPSQIRVFKGEAKLIGSTTSLTIKDGNRVDLAGMILATTKFDVKQGDDLYLWSRDRSAYLAAGNMASARTLAASGYGNTFGTGYGNGMGFGNGYAYSGWNPSMWNGFSGGWYYNQYLNMYSYLPFAGTTFSPFGYGYYNPVTIGSVYSPGYYWTGAGGSRTGTTTGLPLASLTPTGTANKPALPRLGMTASARPTLSAAIPTSQGGSNSSGILSPRNNGFNPTVDQGSSSSAALSARPAASAPVAAAPAAASAGAARTSVSRR